MIGNQFMKGLHQLIHTAGNNLINSPNISKYEETNTITNHLDKSLIDTTLPTDATSCFIAYLITLGILNLYYLITTIFFYKRSKTRFLSKRSPIISLTMTAFNLIAMNFALIGLPPFFPILDKVPCLVKLYFSTVFQDLWLFTFVIRGIYLAISYCNRVCMTKGKMTCMMHYQMDKCWGMKTDRVVISKNDQFFMGVFYFLTTGKFKRWLPTTAKNNKIPISSVCNRNGFFNMIFGCGLLIDLFLILVVCFSSANFFSDPLQSSLECLKWDSWLGIVDYIFFGGFFILLGICLYVLRNVRDAYYIKMELAIFLSVCCCFYVIYCLAHMSDGVLANLWGKEIWVLISLVFGHTLSITFPSIMANKWEEQNKVMALEFDRKSFEIVLYDPDLWASFKDHVAKDLSIENCLYYERISSLRTKVNTQNLSNYSFLNEEPELKEHVTDIFNTFVQTGGEFELNIANDIRNSASCAILNGSYTYETFNPVTEEVLQILYFNCFRGYITQIQEEIDFFPSV